MGWGAELKEMEGNGGWTRWWLGSLAIAVAGLPALGQRECSLPLVPASGPHATTSPDRILRDIRDPHTGDHWILLPNRANPAGPGRLVVAAHDDQRRAVVCMVSGLPAIRPGDMVVVEEHIAAVEAYLEAVALEPAQLGTRLNVRLKIGNRVVRAVAIAPGRVAMAP
jgi:hypothetical protein